MPTTEITDTHGLPWLLLTVALAVIGFLLRIGWSDLRDKMKSLESVTREFGNPEDFMKRFSKVEEACQQVALMRLELNGLASKIEAMEKSR